MRRLALTATVVLLGAAGCASDSEDVVTPGLADRGTTMTTVQPTRQDLVDRLSLNGEVVINPVFGIVAPTDGEVHYYNVPWPKSTPTKPVRAANVWLNGNKTQVDVPAGATFAGRLARDYSTVVAGMPILSARWVGYAIVAQIEPEDAYRVADNLSTVRAQITNGPGPFDCTVLGTVAALPGGHIPEPAPFIPDPKDPPEVQAQKQADYERVAIANEPYRPTPSEATAMRIVCLPPAGTRLINGVDATVEVVSASSENALVLPGAAVAGRHGTGRVTVVLPDGSTQEREVGLGLTDGKYIEIISGLTENDTVAVPGPNIPPGDPSMPELPVVER